MRTSDFLKTELLRLEREHKNMEELASYHHEQLKDLIDQINDREELLNCLRETINELTSEE